MAASIPPVTASNASGANSSWIPLCPPDTAIVSNPGCRVVEDDPEIPALTERADPTGDVSGQALGSGRCDQRATPAADCPSQLLGGEPAIDRKHCRHRLVVDLSHERLEDTTPGHPDCFGHRDPIAVPNDLRHLVTMDSIVRPDPIEGLGRPGGPTCHRVTSAPPDAHAPEAGRKAPARSQSPR